MKIPSNFWMSWKHHLVHKYRERDVQSWKIVDMYSQKGFFSMVQSKSYSFIRFSLPTWFFGVLQRLYYLITNSPINYVPYPHRTKWTNLPIYTYISTFVCHWHFIGNISIPNNAENANFGIWHTYLESRVSTEVST